MDVLSIQKDIPRLMGNDPGNRFQQGRLSAAVRSDDRGDLLIRYTHAQILHDEPIVIAYGKLGRKETIHPIPPNR